MLSPRRTLGAFDHGLMLSPGRTFGVSLFLSESPASVLSGVWDGIAIDFDIDNFSKSDCFEIDVAQHY